MKSIGTKLLMAAVCLTVLALAIYMMIRATGRIRAMRADSHGA